MITSVTYKPLYLGPAYNPIIWSVLSSKVNNTDFKYVFDIYIDGIYTNRIKQRANPTGYGMLDISTIMQGQLDSNAPTSPITQGETSIDWANAKFFQDNQFMSKHVYLKVGEEYTANGVTNIYIGTADQVGNPAYALYSGNSTLTNIPIQVFAASITDHEQQWSMQDPTESGIFGGNPFNGNVVYDHGIDLSHPLNFNSLEQDLYVFDKMTLSWLNWSPYPTREKRPIYGFTFTFTDPLLNEYSWQVPMMTARGYAQRAACTSTVNTTLDARYDLVHVLASPADLVTAISSMIGQPPLAIGPGWKIKIVGNTNASDGSCTFGAEITETVNINVVEYCAPLYERVRLSWFNSLGGRDYWNFTMFDEKTINTKQDTYAQEQMDWSSSRPVPQLNDSPIIRNLGVRGGNKALNKVVTTTRKIQTDWLTQEQVNLLEGLQKSVQVLAYIHDDNNSLSDYYAYTCQVSNAAYTTKNIRQQKLVQVTFDLTYVMSQNMQNL
jgi:hypothetical protein